MSTSNPPIPSTQKALVITTFLATLSSTTLRLSTIPTPTPSPHTLLIRITHASPTHVDLLYARGRHQNNRRHARPPLTLGMDFAGEVVHAPAGHALAPGTRVYGSAPGAFAEWVAVPVGAAAGLRRVPRGWSAAEACAVGASGAVSLGTWRRGGTVRKGEWVLVTGATGGLGVYAVQIAARYYGARVIGLVGPQGAAEKEELLMASGCEAVVRYDLPHWEDSVREIAGGEGVHMVYDGVGMVESCLKCCRYGGMVVIVGFAGRDGDIEKIRANRILLKSAGVTGFRFGETARRDPGKARQILLEFDGLVNQGMITPIVYKPEKEYRGVEDIPRALLDLQAKKVWGRSVITIADESDRSRL